MQRSNPRLDRGRRRTIGVALVAGLIALLPASLSFAQDSCGDPWPLRRAMFMYTHSGMPTQTLDQIADRFEFVVEGYRPDLEYMLNKNSRLQYAAFYNSLTDNYVGDDSEHQWLMANAGQFGLDGEDAYLHFWEDTVVELQGQQITIPGWNPNRSAGDPPASATSRADARCPVYFSSLARRVTNFSTPAVRDLHRAYNVSRFKQPMVGSHYPGGVMFDNSGNSALQVRIVSGGRVAEDPAHSQFNSGAFMDWYWMQGVRIFLNELREYIDNNPSEFGGREPKVIPNVANVPYIGSSDWLDSYLNSAAGHVLALEFEYNPTRDFGANLPAVIHDRHTQALAAGVSLFETGYVFKGRGDLVGSFTEDEAILNNIAAHWVHRADDRGMDATTYILGANVWDPVNYPDKFAKNLAPAFDIDLGRPLGPPYEIQSGTDGKGYSYKIFGRAFACGFAVVRHRDPYNGDFDATTDVQFDLPREYTPVNLMGDELRPVTSWSLRNGEGQIFLAAPGEPNLVAPAPPSNLREVQQN